MCFWCAASIQTHKTMCIFGNKLKFCLHFAIKLFSFQDTFIFLRLRLFVLYRTVATSHNMRCAFLRTCDLDFENLHWQTDHYLVSYQIQCVPIWNRGTGFYTYEYILTTFGRVRQSVWAFSRIGCISRWFFDERCIMNINRWVDLCVTGKLTRSPYSAWKFIRQMMSE